MFSSLNGFGLTEILVGIVVLLLLIAYIKIRSSLSYWKVRNVPHVAPSYPFGNLRDVVFQNKFLANHHEEIYKKFQNERYFGHFSFQTPYLFIKDPELLKHVFVKDFQHFYDRGAIFDAKDNPLTEHLLFLTGRRWKIARSKLSPTFTSGKMKMMFPLVRDCSNTLIEYLKDSVPDGSEINAKDLMSDFTTDSVSSAVFGLQSSAIRDKNSKFKQMGAFLFEPHWYEFVLNLVTEWWPAVLTMFKLKIIPPKNEKFFLTTIKDTLDYRDKHKIQRNDFIQMLIQLRDFGKVEDADDGTNEQIDKQETKEQISPDNDLEITDNFLAAQAFVFLVAGLETSSSTLGYCLHSLAFNHDIQDRLREETSAVLEKHGGLTYAALQDMTYMDMVLEETLRLYPILYFLIRTVTKNYTIPGSDVHLEKGFVVKIPVYSIQRDPKYYPNPLKFDPERFSEENKKNMVPFTYMPFGDGPRVCIGMRFAYLQMKTALANLITNFKVDTCSKTENPIVFNKNSLRLLQPKSGIWVKMSKL